MKNVLQSVFAVNPETVSKVVDENGEPMVVWHGGRIFDEFSKSPAAGAHYASSDMEAAQTFADQYGKGESEVKPIFLRILNPAQQEEMPRSGSADIEAAKQAGHDGILAPDTDAANRGEYESFAFWQSNQAKSAGADFDTLWGTPVRTESNNGDFSESDSMLLSSPAAPYSYRTESNRGDVRHIVSTRNERTGKREDRTFETYREAKEEMDRLDELSRPATADDWAAFLNGSLASSPSQPDLFTAATAPDAAEKLGDVKVGRMNALAAYRSLTAKRDKGQKLDAKEEQQLLDAEQALGQKLAFDMDSVKGSAPAVVAQDATTPPPAFGSNRRQVQDEMMRSGEIDSSGQISLLSSASNQRPTKVVKVEIPANFPDVSGGMKPMVKWAKENVKGIYPAPALDADVEVTNYGINHTAAQLARNPKRMKVIAGLPSLIESARVIYQPTDEIIQMHALAEIDGKIHLARITVEERTGDQRGPWNRFYDIKGLEIENALDAMSAFPSITEGSLLAIPGREVTFAQLSAIVNKAENRGNRLFSSAPSFDPVAMAMEKAAPIYRKVYSDIMAGDSPADVMAR